MKHYHVWDAANGCRGCTFEGALRCPHESCMAGERHDGRSVVFTKTFGEGAAAVLEGNAGDYVGEEVLDTRL